MKKTCGIYKITSPNKRVYIGQSIWIEKRFWQYKCRNKNTQPRIHSSLSKYGWRKHKFEIIHECTRDELNDLEIYYVALYNSTGKMGLNIKTGGDCAPIADETKEKLRICSLGNKNASGVRTKEMRERMSVAQRNKKKPTAETCIRISEALKKSEKLKLTMQSKEYKEKMRVSITGKKWTYEQRKRLKDNWKNRKPIDPETKARIISENIKRNKNRTYKKGYKLPKWHVEKLKLGWKKKRSIA